MAANSHEQVLEDAATWFSRLRTHSVSAETLDAFFAWRSDPENEAAYNEVEALWRSGDALHSDPDIRAAANEALNRTTTRRPEPSRRLFALAAATVLALSGALTAGWLLRAPVYQTEIGEQRAVRLADGSTLTLDTNSRAIVRMRGDERRVELARGQAMFAVARDAKRPFVVSVDKVEVRALGTQFDVRRDADKVRVTLLEGKVRVNDSSSRAWTLRPGEQITTGQDGPRVLADTSAVTSWTSGRLVFRDLPLSAAVEEANRYSRRKIRLAASNDIAAAHVNGVFHTGDIDALAEAVAHLYALDLSTEQDGDLLLRARME